MKKYIFLSVAMLSLCAATSCSNDNDSQESKDKVLLFEPKIDAALNVTSILKSSFDKGDKVSLFVWNGADNDAPTTEEFAIFNKQFTSHGSAWTMFDDTTSLKSFAQEAVVAATYPQLFTSSTIADAQSVDVGIESATLYCRGAISEFNDELLAPTFKNMQAQLSFNINGTTQSATSMSFKATISTSAKLNIFSGELTPNDATYTSISFAQNSIASNLYSSLMIAQTITEFTITLGSSTYEYSGDGISLNQGEILIQNITLTPPEEQGEVGDIALGDSFNITEWEKNDEATGDFNFNE